MAVSTDAILGWGVAFSEEWKPEDDDKRGDLEGELMPFRVELVRHCSSPHEMPALFVEESMTTAHRGYPQKIQPVEETPEDWHERLEAAMIVFRRYNPNVDDLGSPEPGWYLASDYGV